MTFLSDLARETTNTTNRIDYATVSVSGKDNLRLLKLAVVPEVNSIVRRQAALQALHDQGRSVDVIAYCANGVTGDSGYLASTGVNIRSSHSGTPVDRGLPQGPYLPAAPPAGLVAGNVRGQANYAWLIQSTTDHTTAPDPALGSGLAADPTRIASYFEITLSAIGRRMRLVDGGRLCYDPFHHRCFVSEHYAVQYELVNLPVVTAHAVYNPLRQEIQAFDAARTAAAAAVAAGAAGAVAPDPWSDLYDSIVDRMSRNIL